METNFSKGELIVPNDDIKAAFIFDPLSSELIDGVSYRVANSAEFIWWSKNRNMRMMDGNIESYKKAMGHEVSEVYKSIDKEKANQKKQGLS